MKSVNIHAAKTHLSSLVERAAAGEEIVIAKAGKPMARLMAYAPHPTRRKPGGLKGQLRIREDFDAPLPRELAKAFGLEK